MELDPQTLLNFALGLGVTVGGWFARQLFEGVQRLSADIQRIEVDLPKTYVTKSDFTAALLELGRKLDRISDKLDAKEDK